jgi:hypothetical protein
VTETPGLQGCLEDHATGTVQDVEDVESSRSMRSPDHRLIPIDAQETASAVVRMSPGWGGRPRRALGSHPTLTVSPRHRRVELRVLHQT